MAGEPPAAAKQRRRSGEISVVEAGSLAAEAGLRPGDRILAVDGRPVQDQLDYRFRTAEEVVTLTVSHDGVEGAVEFEKPADEPLGIEFADDAFGGTTLCNNKCFFCFLKGLPKGLRKSLYVKDDDYRLSFLHGNFVTLTNLEEADWQRLGEQRLSPLNVSVHATDPALRREMLGNPRAPDIRGQLRRLARMGVSVQTQVVLCPGVNDGAALDETVGELLGHANVLGISVVPVGSSLEGEKRIKHPGMRACTTAEARAVVRQIRRWQKRACATRNGATVYPSDEFYLTAGARIPSANLYDGFSQWENGVGMTRTLMDDWGRARRRIRAGRYGPPVLRHVTIATGALIAPTLRRLAAEAADLLDIRIDVIAIHNTLFGERVNVAGLLPGSDFAEQLASARGLARSERLFLPRASLDYFGRRFLDDLRSEELSATLRCPLTFAYTLSEVIEWVTVEGDGTPAPRPLRSNGRSWAVASC